MWCYISASKFIHSLPSWLHSTSPDSAFPSLGCLDKTFYHALRLHSPSYSERNPSENAKKCNFKDMRQTSFSWLSIKFDTTTAWSSLRWFPRNPSTIILKACQAFLSKIDICSSRSSDANILLICGPTNIPNLTFASDMLGNIYLIWRKARLVGFKVLTNCLVSPSLICNEGSKILLLSIRYEFRTLWEPGVRSLRADQFLTK